ncbi:RDD family protein [Thalassoglobus polymorphus]|uniref:RDD family protein n=1 Tax=Thalassoglobus polymorphus TaxID=2527994 RepID=A0A517QRD9_9PLAN|nr:RDD family protein [Thalassoglobus polymorphus]QDT34196.1 RDD family protein [Thalassoglobus polymorphus]
MSVQQADQQSTIHIVDTRTEIETPENVILTFDLAGPGSRASAYIIDLALRMAVAWGLIYLIGFMIPLMGDGLPVGILLVGIFLLEWGYTALFEGFCNGQTPGKKMLKLRVIKDAGYPIHFYDAALRNLLRAADFLPVGYGVGLLSMAATKRMQRLGDLVAGTIVVRADVHTYKRNPGAFRNVEPILPTECDRRFHVSERTLDVIEQLLWRREQLGRRRVEEIASILAQPIADQLGYRLGDNRNGSRDILFLRRILKTFTSSEQGA